MIYNLKKRMGVICLPEIDALLKKIKRVHFIGIGGSGMCPLAEILHKNGYQISGSDNNETDTLKRIRSLGIPVVMGQKAENIEGAEMIVYTAALLKDNPELVAAKNSGIPTFERSKLLGAVTKMYGNSICVSGTHGKTTTCSMLTQILIECGLDPSAVIGGKLPLTGSNGIVGHSNNMVCEACEFVDTFLDLFPDVAVVLNIDEDHLDYFKTFDNLKKSFLKFSSMATKLVVYNGDDVNTVDCLKPLIDSGSVRMIKFGFDKSNDYYADNIKMDNEYASFDVYAFGEFLGRAVLSVPGRHNIFNALAAVVCAVDAGADVVKIFESITSFTGAGRRFEKLAVINGVTICDDYAHHPAELEATLNTAMKMGFNRVWAVFQPFTFSRTKILFDEFVRVLQIPDKCVMTEIMGSREINTYGIYTSQLSEKIPGSVWFNTFDEVAEHVVNNVEDGDLVIILGCGDIYKAAKIMIKLLEERK